MITRLTTDPYLLAIFASLISVLLATLLYIFVTFINKKILDKSQYLNPEQLGKVKGSLTVYVASVGIFLGIRQLPELGPWTLRLTQIYFIFSTMLIAFVLALIISALIRHHVRQTHKHQSTPKILDLIIKIIIFTVAIITILQYFQVQITAIIATLSIGGLAVGLALQNTIANLFAGIHLIATEPVRVGDFIEIEFQDLKGYVVDIGWRETKVRQINNTIVIVPNAKLAESVIVNDSMPEEQLACLVECGVDYTSNLWHVEDVTLQVARQCQQEIEGAIKEHVPYMRFTKFGDNNINFTVYLRVERYYDRLVMTHEFIKRLKHAYDENGIEISWPIRKIYNK